MKAPLNQDGAVFDHSRHYNDFIFVYPVISRRSGGLSLGVNLNPDKICNFNCVYCEVDHRVPIRATQVDVARMSEELSALIQRVRDGRLAAEARFRDSSARVIKDIAFSGDGEPTMAPNFSACAQAVAAIKQAAGLTDTKMVLITNAAGLDKTDVRAGLAIMDANQGEIWGKLDAGTEAYYRQADRSFIRFDRILANLLSTAQTRPIVIQSLFFKMRGEVMPPEELDAYCERLKHLVRSGGQIKEVHAYTIARPTPENYATRLEPNQLEAIASTIRTRTGLAVKTFA
jgi:wyosine [tRNA(Phe)-imidazoG37] synthetase (radical SAM superfamily)